MTTAIDYKPIILSCEQTIVRFKDRLKNWVTSNKIDPNSNEYKNKYDEILALVNGFNAYNDKIAELETRCKKLTSLVLEYEKRLGFFGATLQHDWQHMYNELKAEHKRLTDLRDSNVFEFVNEMRQTKSNQLSDKFGQLRSFNEAHRIEWNNAQKEKWADLY